jgi:hypothetical protein
MPNHSKAVTFLNTVFLYHERFLKIVPLVDTLRSKVHLIQLFAEQGTTNGNNT